MAYSLTLLILLFSGVPCCTADASCEEATQTVTGPGADHQNEDHESDGPCSPFYTCGTCVGFVQAIGLQYATPPEIMRRPEITTFYPEGVPEVATHRLLRPPIPEFS